ncbi:MAG TPA: hypothetical protein VKS01_12420 [Bryobacteraceae bacterium]|nr:hypothetical protein [Bryobacteraceae bacterium]
MPVSQQLGSVASALQGVQGQIPSTDTDSVSKLNQAYALISGVQATYQAQGN